MLAECHLFLYWAFFKTVTKEAAHLQKLLGVTLLLSGTVPPDMEPKLGQMFGSSFETVRAPTDRLELAYTDKPSLSVAQMDELMLDELAKGRLYEWER